MNPEFCPVLVIKHLLFREENCILSPVLEHASILVYNDTLLQIEHPGRESIENPTPPKIRCKKTRLFNEKIVSTGIRQETLGHSRSTLIDTPLIQIMKTHPHLADSNKKIHDGLFNQQEGIWKNMIQPVVIGIRRWKLLESSDDNHPRK